MPCELATSEEDVVKLLQQIDDDPASYDALIDNWNLVFDLGRQQGNDTFSKLEAAASSTIPSMTEAASASTLAIGRRVGHLLEQFDSPAYLVRKTGKISAQNTVASQTYHIPPNGTLDDLPFALEQGERISAVVGTSLNPGRNTQDAILKRAFSSTNDTTATLSIAPSMAASGGEGTALVFVIDARWKTNAAGLLKREFDLTRAEQEILVRFLDGQSIQDMAHKRQRSLSTIRSQFHSLMSKMGARSQTELLRNALSISQFVDQIEEIAEVIRHPHRKRVDIVRPGGRSVEITMAGDPNGTPLVFLPDITAYTFDSQIEQVFHDSGYCVYSLCRPGFGDTDPPLAGETRLETFAADLDALLTQLDCDHCALMSTVTSTGFMFYAAQFLPQRIKGLIQVGGLVPRSYYEKVGSSSSWAQGVLNAAGKHGVLKDFIVTSGIRAWKTLGPTKFFQMQFRSAPEAERKLALNPETLKESQAALDTATKQSLEPTVYDLSIAFSDYKLEVAATRQPILVIHGANNTVVPIDGVREFARDVGARLTLVELPDAGYSAMRTHTNAIMREIANFR